MNKRQLKKHRKKCYHRRYKNIPSYGNLLADLTKGIFDTPKKISPVNSLLTKIETPRLGGFNIGTPLTMSNKFIKDSVANLRIFYEINDDVDPVIPVISQQTADNLVPVIKVDVNMKKW